VTESPCVGICELDAEGLVCVGCLRTLDEIAGWTSYSEAERQRVIEDLARRRGDLPD
jgi:predicted Fe-S protein YdhL (DUF1289 family)